MAAAAYQSGEKLYSQYDGDWKSSGRAERVAYKEILLPPNAPREYADRQALWNAVDVAEKGDNAQTARRFIIALPKELTLEQNTQLIRDFCQTQFVDKGMITDIAIHDDHDGNPHAHVLCTMRAIDEHGKWLPKTKTTYTLDENGQRIMGKNGKWQRVRMDTVDWNDQKYCEIWRHEWEVMQNVALENADREERIDMRSFERQGIDKAPTIHLGPAATRLERKGIHTQQGDHNREVHRLNALLESAWKKLKSVADWLKELVSTLSAHQVIQNPDDYNLGDVVSAYIHLRKAERFNWKSSYARQKGDIRDIQEMSQAIIVVKKYNIFTVRQLGKFLNENETRLREIKSTIRAKEKRIRDIHDIQSAVDTMKALKPIMEKYDQIHWKSSKEKYAAEHAEEIAKYRKADRLLHKLNVQLPISRKTLNAEAAQLQSEIESFSPEIEAISKTLTDLKLLRRMIRKVMPDALPYKNQYGQRSAEDLAESAANRQELNHLLVTTAKQVMVDPDEMETPEDDRESLQQTPEQTVIPRHTDKPDTAYQHPVHEEVR